MVGESGSGKSTLVNAILRLLDSSTAVGGEAFFAGRDILRLSERAFRALRGRQIGFVPQDPTASLNPVRRIDHQVYESFRESDQPEHADRQRYPALARGSWRRSASSPRAGVAVVSASTVRWTVAARAIGLAIAGRPQLIVADEPTSALDVTIQKTILDLLDSLKAEFGVSILLITHDLSLAAERSDQVVVLNDGELQEHGPVKETRRRPDRRMRAPLSEISHD